MIYAQLCSRGCPYIVGGAVFLPQPIGNQHLDQLYGVFNDWQQSMEIDWLIRFMLVHHETVEMGQI